MSDECGLLCVNTNAIVQVSRNSKGVDMILFMGFTARSPEQRNTPSPKAMEYK